MKAAIWIRVSTVEQTTTNQEPVLHRVCEARQFDVVKVFDVTASAFKGDQQAALDALMESASRGDFKVLVVWALERLERRGGEEMIILLGRLADRGVTVISHQEAWVERTRAPMLRKFLVFFMGWMAEAESRRRSERSLAGLGQGEARG